MTDLLHFWSQHTPIFSILLPAITAFSLVLLGNPGSGSLTTDWRQLGVVVSAISRVSWV